MKLLPASFQARLETFGLTPSGKPKTKAKPRRASARGKKASTASDDLTWPLSAPVPYDLAYAGFVFRPTSASPDNVQCFDCGCQLDGWEETDVPAYEHLTHSPTCGFAINICIRLRQGDPDRVEEDPMSEKMMEARRATFADYWPLDTAAGFPGVEQMVEAGWYYDPTEECPDGVTCPYCSLSLDSWDAGDDPLEEHRRRVDSTAGCLFFTLKELYQPAEIPQPKPKKGKRGSTRSSTASTKSVTKKAPAKKAAATKTKTTRGKPAAPVHTSSPEPVEIPALAPKPKATRAKRQSQQTVTSDDIPPAAKSARGRARQSEETNTDVDVPLPKKRGRPSKRQSEQTEAPSEIVVPAQKGRKRESQQPETHEDIVAPAPPAPPARGRKRKSERTEIEIEPEVVVPPPVAKGKKRKSEATETSDDIGFVKTKRTRSSAVPQYTNPHSSLPDWDTFSPPASMIAGTPPAVFQETPARQTTPTPKEHTTPEQSTPLHIALRWKAVDIDSFFEKENLPAIADLTDAEKQMTIQQFLTNEAKRQEDELRTRMHKQIAMVDAEFNRALATIDEL